jgi:hypothetical protein
MKYKVGDRVWVKSYNNYGTVKSFRIDENGNQFVWYIEINDKEILFNLVNNNLLTATFDTMITRIGFEEVHFNLYVCSSGKYKDYTIELVRGGYRVGDGILRGHVYSDLHEALTQLMIELKAKEIKW